MRALDIIERKRDGKELSAEQISFLIDSLVSGDIPEYQISAWLMAVYFRGLSVAETVALTDALVRSGDRLDLSDLGVVVDKHSTGGVGDKTTLVVVPIVAALGVPVAKLSGRGLGHTGGTLDKLESIPGMRTDLSLEELKRQVAKIGVAVAGQTADIVPGDKRLYALRDVTGTVANIGLIAASVMSKKIAGGARALVLDVKVGTGAFMKDVEDARNLAKLMVKIGSASSLATRTVMTSMDDVLGWAVGNSLEVAESVAVLKGEGPSDLVEVCEVLAGEMAVLGGIAEDRHLALSEVRRVVSSGLALETFERWIAAQGGDPRITEDIALLPAASHSLEFKAESAGYLTAVDAEAIGRAASILGAGRIALDDVIDPAAGLVVRHKLGDQVAVGETIAVLHSNDPNALDIAAISLSGVWEISSEPVPPGRIILGTIEK